MQDKRRLWAFGGVAAVLLCGLLWAWWPSSEPALNVPAEAQQQIEQDVQRAREAAPPPADEPPLPIEQRGRQKFSG